MKSEDEPIEGVFEWKNLTNARRGTAGCRLTSQRAREGVVGVLDHPPDKFLPTKHERKEVDAAQKDLDTLNESLPILTKSQDGAMPTIFKRSEIQCK